MLDLANADAAADSRFSCLGVCGSKHRPSISGARTSSGRQVAIDQKVVQKIAATSTRMSLSRYVVKVDGEVRVRLSLLLLLLAKKRRMLEEERKGTIVSGRRLHPATRARIGSRV